MKPFKLKAHKIDFHKLINREKIFEETTNDKRRTKIIED